MSNKTTTELIARALIRHRGHTLVCTNLAKGYHYLPGGHIEHREPAAAALAREMKEECGLRCRVGKLAAVAECCYRRKGKQIHELNLVFHVELSARPGLVEVRSLEPDIGFAWLSPNEFKRGDVRPVSLRSWAASRRAAGMQVAWISDIR